MTAADRHREAGTAVPWTADLRADAVWATGAAVLGATAIALGGYAPVLLAGGALALAFALWAPVRPELAVIALLATSALDVMGRLGRVGPVTVTAYQAVLVFAVLLAARTALAARSRPPALGIDGWLGLLVAAGAAGLPGAVDRPQALVAWVSLCSSVAMVYLVRALLTTRERFAVTLIAFVALTAALGVLAIIERAGLFAVQEFYRTTADGIRARVFFKDPNILGGVLAAGAATGFGLALGERRAPRAGALWSCAALAAFGVVATLSRGALLGLACGLVAAVLIAPLPRGRKTLLLTGGTTALIALLAFTVDPRWIAEKVLGIAAESSALKRVHLATAALAMYRDNPLGIGPGMWPEVLPAYRPYDLPANLLESHNTYLTLLVESGIVGLVGFVGAIASSGARLVRAVRAGIERPEDGWRATAVAAGSTVLVVQSLTYSMETSKFLWFFVGAALTAASFALRREGD